MNSMATFNAGAVLQLPECPARTSEVWVGAAQQLRVVNVVDEAPDVKTFMFEAERPSLFSYRAGQFLTLELPTAAGPLLRTYTIASSPSRPMTISVTVKAQATSIGTRWMFENLSKGSLLKAIGPAGAFTLDLSRRHKLLFVSAGSGVTPMMSMLRWLSDVSPDADVTFLHCARSPADIIFRTELACLAHLMPNLKLGFVVEHRSSDWSGLSGRLDSGKLKCLVPDLLDREIFCCGPDPFMAGMRSLAAAAGFTMEHYHEEAFSFAPAVTAEVVIETTRHPPAAESGAAGTSVRFQVSGVEGNATPDETVLAVARRCGVRLPSVCEIGLCGTCKVKMASGDVDMSHDGGITGEEIAEGYILACCSKPLSPVEIEI
ncbi:2Fe-2S iron-sulfur cluster-binding protein [Rhizobium sp. LEGMi198b]